MTNNNNDGHERLFYNGAELLGTQKAERNFTPNEMLELLTKYENLIRTEKYDEAERIEATERIPETWLNCVISNLIKENRNRLAEKLIGRFSNRGYDKNWLEKSNI